MKSGLRSNYRLLQLFTGRGGKLFYEGGEFTGFPVDHYPGSIYILDWQGLGQKGVYHTENPVGLRQGVSQIPVGFPDSFYTIHGPVYHPTGNGLMGVGYGLLQNLPRPCYLGKGSSRNLPQQ